MAAPDLPTATHETIDRPTFVHLAPDHVSAEALRDGVVVVIDTLRASTSIATALANGAAAIVPALTVDEAVNVAALLRAQGERTLLGGERGGVRIAGFDLDNSPRSFARERVAGATIVFTSSNGTAALRHASGAARVIVGTLANISAVCAVISKDERPVHLLCAATRGDITLDDALVAGAFAARLVELGRGFASDDSARLCAMAWASIAEKPGKMPDRDAIRRAFWTGRGGRNLIRLGLQADIDDCAAIDSLHVVPEFSVGLARVRSL